MFTLQDVGKTYRPGAAPVRALDGIDLEIDDGEFVALVGPSGSGKTTLLQLLGGLDRPSAGSVLFDGRDLARLGDGDLTAVRREAFGFIFQQFNLIPTLTAAENVEAALVPTGVRERERRDRSADALAAVGLASRGAHLPSELSGGEQQRVAIARALVGGPRVVLADEPTGNLDSRTGGEVMDIIERLNREEGKTVVLITHDEAVAARAGRRLQMRDGRLIGRPAAAPPG
jgi:putative ABC transport system ATP-binding protein